MSMRKSRLSTRNFWLVPFIMAACSFTLRSQVQPDEKNQLLAPLPDPLVTEGGVVIENATQWESDRREEVLELFRDHVYGRVPEMGVETDFQVKFMNADGLSGSAIMKEVEVRLFNAMDTVAFSILLYLPKDHAGPVPLFVGLNFYGNHTLDPDPDISLTGSWLRNNKDFHVTENKATIESRGVRSGRWPVELILSRGYGLATIYCGDIDPDFDDGFINGVHRLAGGAGANRTGSSWGTIAAWAWGLSRSMDYFEQDADIDAGRVAVIGHSRLGKTALWAGAQDERFALVISNCSGCGGAALSRRPFGERVSRINTSFPHWFADRFNDYNDNEAACPVDQHMLMALVAPRPLYVASASEDDWADPHGEYLSLVYGSKVYGLYGEDVMDREDLPVADQPRWKGKLGYHMRTGKHDITPYDWEHYLDFADQHMGPAGGGFVNPVSMEWIRDHIRTDPPRLILTPEVESLVRRKLENGDKITRNGLKLLAGSADALLEVDPLVYKQTGRRLLGVSREAIHRLTTLALVYRFEKDEKHLERLEEELKAVCSFEHWNPSHFLDVAEMAAGVALALDWAGEWISPEVNKFAKEALVEKALKPGLAAAGYNSWVNAHNNWNLVCHGGLALAAIAVFEDEPELASRVLHQSVEKIPLALQPYAPGGIYPEGPSYWFYATTYLTAAISAFESSLGTDFGFTKTPGVMESAIFSQVLAGPSGEYYNYFDASLGGYNSLAHFGLLAWFTERSGPGVDMETYQALLKKELSEPRQVRSTRFFSTHFLDLTRLDQKGAARFTCPEVWIAGGGEPVGVFRDPENAPGSFFLAAKGGMASDNHGNMDAGSFILELDGVRWSADPGNQGYHELEQLMGTGLWNKAQDSPRWSLLTKNNFGHSTLTVNDQMHLVDGRAKLARVDLRDPYPEFTFDMTPLFGEEMKKARRTFKRTAPDCLVISDDLVPSGSTEAVTWQMITTAEVTTEADQVVLSQDGKKLFMRLQHEIPHEVKVVDLSPPPLTYDKEIEGLKRIDIRINREDLSNPLAVELTSEPNTSKPNTSK